MERVNLWLVLPEETITQITKSLDLKSMIKCMVVCKEWRNLISDLISNDPLVAKGDLEFLVCPNELVQFGTLDDETHQIAWMKPLDFPLRSTYHAHHAQRIGLTPRIGLILSSCNGLVCFLPDDDYWSICICNPLTGEYIAFWNPDPMIRYHVNGERLAQYDLGFCPSSNEYKLTMFTMYALLMCTLRSPIQWRNVPFEEQKLRIPSRAAICVGAVFHWLLKDGSIVTFDLAKEVFGSIPLPPLDDGKEIYEIECMDRCLVVTAGYKPALGLEIWARKKDKSSGGAVWTKNWVIDDVLKLGHDKITKLRPQKLSTDGRILMTCDDTCLYSYDPRDKLVTSNNGPRLHKTYTSTLVSPLELMEETD